MLVERLAESDPDGVGHPQQHEIERAGSDSDRPHAVVNSSGTETALDDLESATPATDHVLQRNADVLVDDLEVSLGSIVVAELSKGRGR